MICIGKHTHLHFWVIVEFGFLFALLKAFHCTARVGFPNERIEYKIYTTISQ